MGIVYEAFDRERNMRVALKTLRAVDPTSLYRFKREFRALADTAHANLISLYELFAVEGQWFFTMEVIDGSNWLDYVRHGSARLAAGTESGERVARPSRGAPPTSDDTDPTAATGVATLPNTPSARAGSSGSGRSEGPRAQPPLTTAQQLARLRATLSQLVAGVAALHRAGHVHRDIKPSNVMVTPDERVVLLDFGVVAELTHQIDTAAEHRIIGTPAYMAPEQGQGAALSASDWYAVGVMLWEALVGRQPFTGPSEQVLGEKLHVEPPAPRTLNPAVPEDLDQLCVDLLRIEPSLRPGEREIAARLGIRSDAVAPTAENERDRTDTTALLVGREAHLQRLHDALSDTHRGLARAVYVHGSSGMGKSALISTFLQRAIDGDPDTVVLSGRCYERESMPYKAVDALIDSLSRYLMELPRAEADALLPRDIVWLARVFPVLRRVEAVAQARRRGAAAPDPQQLRLRAFAALRELLGRIAAQRPLVLVIDDLQWGDLDSAPLLETLLRPPDPPPMLLIGAYRSEDEDSSALLRALRRRRDDAGDGPARVLAVEPLPFDDARDLAAALLHQAGANADAAPAIARESGGSPYFVDELVRFVLSGGKAAPAAGALTLDDVIRARIDQLPRTTRRALEVVAVAGMPTEQRIVQRAANLDEAERPVIFQSLRAAHLVRLSGARDDDLIETYHDRIRETVIAGLPDSVRVSHHSHLARAVQSSSKPDPELLAMHYWAAGDRGAAAEYAILAGDQAARALAFDRAAELYRAALDGQPWADPERHELETKLGHALANGGRGPEAARTYLQASSHGPEANALELRRLAAMQFFASGHVDDGLAVLREVLAAVGLELPRRGARGIVSFLWRRSLLGLRGLRYRARDPSGVRPAELIRADVCWSAAVGLSMVDPVLAGTFHTRYLMLSLKAGDVYRIGRGLAMEASHVATPGARTEARCAKLLAAAAEIADDLDDRYLKALVSLNRGGVAFLNGRWADAHAQCERANESFRQCTGVTWELNTSSAFGLWPLYHLGEFAELARRAPALLQDAMARGDLYAFHNLATWIRPLVGVAADEPERALRELDALIAEMNPGEFHLQHLNAIVGKMQLLLYTDDGEAAWRLVTDAWPAVRRSLLLTVQQVRVSMHHLRAIAALTLARSSDRPAPLLKSAARDARKVLAEKLFWATPLAQTTQAALAMFRDDPERASVLLFEAARGFDAADMPVFRAVCERRRGELVGGAEGRELARGADELMRARGIRNPERLAAAVVPLARRPPLLLESDPRIAR